MTKYDLSQAFELGKLRKKIIYCDRNTVDDHCTDYGSRITKLISESFNANRFYHRISFNRYDKKWNHNKLEKLYGSQLSGLFVIMNKPVEFNKLRSSEPAITQYASIDIYNAFIRKSIEQALNDCGLTDKNEPSYSTNEVTVNSESGSIHIVRRLHDEFIARLKQRVFDVILAEVCEYNDGAIRKFLRANKIEPHEFADQLFDKFQMKDRRFYFDLQIGKEEKDDTVQHVDTI